MKKLTAGDPETMSLDLIAENIECIKALFPELVTEGPYGASLNVDLLKALVGDKNVSDAEEKYGLSWHGKRRARQLALTPSIGTLRPCMDESVEWCDTQNLMIEGDNLEVLKLLLKGYAGRVKLIYIDPPYNTGKDFVYPDNYKESLDAYLRMTGQRDHEGNWLTSNAETSGRFHTDWLNMIYPRIYLSRHLLSDDGSIFISCDDHELANYLHILDEVFGESSRIGIFAIKTPNQTEDKYKLRNLDYLICYSKSGRASFNLKRKDQSARCTTGKPSQTQPEIEFPPGIECVNIPDGIYEQPEGTGGNEDIRVISGRLNVRQGRLTESVTLKARWSNPNDIRAYIAKLKSDSKEPIFNKFGKELTRLWFNGRRFQPQMDKLGFDLPDSFWLDYTRKGSQALSSLIGDNPFDYPKHPEFVKAIVSLASHKDDIVLDFFAGSGTTGHAVYLANAEDQMNRRYVLIQLPEPITDTGTRFTTISDLTANRLRLSAQQVQQFNKERSLDLGFRLFRLDSSNIRTWEPDRNNLAQTIIDYAENIREDRSENDILYELLLKLGLDLCVPIERKDIAGKTMHSIGGGVLMACLAPEITGKDVEPIAQGVVAWHQALAPAGDTTCVFLDSAFADDVAKTNLVAILNQHGLTTVRSL